MRLHNLNFRQCSRIGAGRVQQVHSFPVNPCTVAIIEPLDPGRGTVERLVKCERAIEVSDIFVACFSPRSVLKRGQFQSELRYALDCARKRPLSEPLDAVFIIPVRLEECAVPRRISDQVQYVDLFPDWDKGIRRLVKAIHRSARARPLLALS